MSEYDDPYAYGDVTPPDTPDNPYQYGDVTPPDQSSSGGGWADEVAQGAGLTGVLVQSGNLFGANSNWQNYGQVANLELAKVDGERMAVEARTENAEFGPKGEKGWLSGFLDSIKSNPEAAKIIAGMAGGLYTASVQKQKNAIDRGFLNLSEQKANRAATSMHNVTVPGMGLIGSKPTKPKYNPNIYPQFSNRGRA